jgi:hypothetical protein
MGPTEEVEAEACPVHLGALNKSRGSLPGVGGGPDGGCPPIAPPNPLLGLGCEDMLAGKAEIDQITKNQEQVCRYRQQ